MNSFFQKFVELGYHPDDPKEEKLKKSSLLVVSGPFAIAGLVWGVLYFANGLIVPGAIPFCYGILSVVNIISFGFSKKYKFFRNSQLFLILILPFALQVSLGGFVASSAVIYWAIIAPAGAMFFDSIKRSVYWFVAYLLLVVIAYLIDDKLPGYVNWNLPEDFVMALFLMNIIGVSCIVFGIFFYFVSTITKLNEDIENKNLALKEQSEKLKEMDKIKSRFFANISHEFRTPLTLIIGLVNKQISNAQSPLDPKDSNIIKRNANRLLQLINQLLDLSKLESGQMKLRASRSDIVIFAKNSTALFESLAAEKQIKITFNGHSLESTSSFHPIEIYFDREKLQKVLTNLISNAVKFTPEGGNVAVEVDTVKNAANNGTEAVYVRVINTGVEIPEEKLPHLFDRFFQVEASSNRRFEGTGIGLALVKELVELHNGRVGVESKMHKTSFTVELPMNSEYLRNEEIVDLQSLEIEEMEEEPQQPLKVLSEEMLFDDNEVTSSVGGNQLEVLVVEDNTDLRAFIKEILQKDYLVTEAVDGIDGFQKAAARIPDLIVSDVMMPRMDGYEFCRTIKANKETDHIPVILLTAKAARKDKLVGLQTGADDYLVKPFDEEELRIRIQNLITIREQLQMKFQGEMSLKPREIKVSSVHQKFLGQIKEVIEKNMDNALFGVDDLGKAIGMSRSQVHRKLKALTDQSATNFIRNYRLHRAVELLKQEAGNITEIAYQVGFSSQTYFSSSFQALFGCSPSEYRQKERGPF